jgi:hypothetical protein
MHYRKFSFSHSWLHHFSGNNLAKALYALLSFLPFVHKRRLEEILFPIAYTVSIYRHVISKNNVIGVNSSDEPEPEFSSSSEPEL